MEDHAPLIVLRHFETRIRMEKQLTPESVFSLNSENMFSPCSVFLSGNEMQTCIVDIKKKLRD